MAKQLRSKVPADKVPVTVGDMATTTVPGEFALVYVVWNSIGNVRTQDEQVECFRNAARHLAPGGRFVIELWVPGIRRFPPGQLAVPFDMSDKHVGFDTYDMATQQGTSHHYSRLDDGSVRYAFSNFRYIWPAECDLMARLAGLSLEQRLADWNGTPFTSDSESHVSVWRKPLHSPDEDGEMTATPDEVSVGPWMPRSIICLRTDPEAAARQRATWQEQDPLLRRQFAFILDQIPSLSAGSAFVADGASIAKRPPAGARENIGGDVSCGGTTMQR